ncbi:hypothetical protein E1K68_04755 [Pseudomonas sp. B2021]|nr:hypothetical protein [Pseudomonas sp. B2021]
MRQFVDHGYSRKNDLMDGQRAVFERGMLAQRLLLFRAPARPKRYMNMPPSLALNSANVGAGLPAIQAPCSFRLTEVMPSQASHNASQLRLL